MISIQMENLQNKTKVIFLYIIGTFPMFNTKKGSYQLK